MGELDPGSMTECKIHKSYLWGNRFIVSNVNVDYFSTWRLDLIVYLQQAVHEFFNLKACSFLITKDVIVRSFCPTDHNLHSPPPPCHSYATSWWWAQNLSCSRSVSKGKTRSRITQQPFPCLLTHSRTWPTGTVQQLTHELMEKCVPRSENRWQKHSPHPFLKKQYYLRRKWTNRKDCIRWPVGRWWADEKRGKDKVWLPPTHVHSERCDGWSYWSAHWLSDWQSDWHCLTDTDSSSRSGGLDSLVLQ